MDIFLVDFENVHTAGLKGQNYLKDAVIHVFLVPTYVTNHKSRWICMSYMNYSASM